MRVGIGTAARILGSAAISLAVAGAQQAPAAGSKAISLTEAQQRTMQALMADSAQKVGPMLLKLSQTAKAFNTNLLSEKPDFEMDRKLGREMADMFAEVIQLRIARIRRSAGILTSEQKAALASELKASDTLDLFDDVVKKVLGDPGK